MSDEIQAKIDNGKRIIVDKVDTIKHVEKLDEYDMAIYYKTTCHCGTHDIALCIEYDNYLELLTIFFEASAKIPFYEDGISCEKLEQLSLGKRFTRMCSIIFQRIVIVIKVLFGYEIKFQEEFLFRNKSHINDLILALQEGTKYIEMNATTKQAKA